MSAPVVFVDIETLGLDADAHPVWEVAIVDEGGGEHVWQVEVSQRDITLAHPIALEITRFEERYRASEAYPPDVVADFLRTLIPAGAHLAGACVSFDEERLRRLLWRHGFVPPWHYHLIDVEILAVGFLRGKAEWDGGQWKSWHAPDELMPPWKSEDLSRALGVDPDQFPKHTALGDALWAKAIYEAASTAWWDRSDG